MRIAIFTETFLHKNTAAANQAAVLKKGLQQLGHDVLIVTGYTKAPEITLARGVLCCPAMKTNNFYRQSANRLYTRQLPYYINAFAPQVLHILTMSTIGMVGLRFAQKQGLPLIATVHELHNAQQLDGEQSLHQLFSLVRQPLAQRHAHKILSHSQIVTYSSRQLAAHIEEYAPRAQIIRMPYCVNNTKFCVSPVSKSACSKMRERLGLKPEQTGVIFAGQMHKNNKIDRLLRDWRHYTKPGDTLRLILVGDGPQLSDLQNYALEANLLDRITFAGKLTQAELSTCYAVCDVFVSAATSMTMKASPLEAIACGVPVLLPKNSANADIVIEGQNGFTYERPEELFAWIRHFTGLNQRQRFHLRNMVSRTAERLTPAGQAEIMLKLYRSLLKPAPCE